MGNVDPVEKTRAAAVVSIERARSVAQELLAQDEDRWRHAMGVAECAAALSVTVPPEDADLLVAAAWLHDIGYSDRLKDTGLHPLDGAAYLRSHGWPERIVGLVAHHSGTRFLARLRGLEDSLRRYPDEQSVVSDALTYADQRVGPFGQRMSVYARLADKISRHGADSVQGRASHDRNPYLLAVGDRVEERLRAAGETAWL